MILLRTPSIDRELDEKAMFEDQSSDLWKLRGINTVTNTATNLWTNSYLLIEMFNIMYLLEKNTVTYSGAYDYGESLSGMISMGDRSTRLIN